MSNMSVERAILGGLIYDDEFSRKVIPHIKSDYFEESDCKNIWELIEDYNSKYSAIPTEAALKIELESKDNLSEDKFRDANDLIVQLYDHRMKKAIEKSSAEWLSEKTEKYFKDRAVFLAVRDSISIIDGENKKLSKESIPDLLRDALSVCFDTNIGHDYLEDSDFRYEEYIKKENKIQLGLKWLNDITKGGVPTKSLFVWVAPTGVGKTLLMTWQTTDFLLKGMDVLYVTCEMSEIRISERIDACLMDIEVDELKKMPKSLFERKIENLKTKNPGKLIVKEYPPSTVNCSNIRYLLNELKTKRGFVPKVLVLDYMNLLLSVRFPKSDSMYQSVKAVAEEIRAIAVEFDILIMTATQTNRQGQNASDFELNEVGESHGISQTADIIIGAISTEDLEKVQRLRLKQLKNRFGALYPHNIETVGCDRPKMKIYEAQHAASNTAMIPEKKQSKTMDKLKDAVKEGGNAGFKF